MTSQDQPPALAQGHMVPTGGSQGAEEDAGGWRVGPQRRQEDASGVHTCVHMCVRTEIKRRGTRAESGKCGWFSSGVCIIMEVTDMSVTSQDSPRGCCVP